MEVKENFSSKSLPRYLCLVAHFRHQGGLWYVCRNLFLLPRRQESLADSTHPPYSCKSQKKALVLCLRTLFVTWLSYRCSWFDPCEISISLFGQGHLTCSAFLIWDTTSNSKKVHTYIQTIIRWEKGKKGNKLKCV